jgi:hypothetical protein
MMGEAWQPQGLPLHFAVSIVKNQVVYVKEDTGEGRATQKVPCTILRR